MLIAAPWSGTRGKANIKAFENQVGEQAPMGFWDPWGFGKDGHVGDFMQRRVAELKHGRVAMYAPIGYIVPEYFKWPG